MRTSFAIVLVALAWAGLSSNAVAQEKCLALGDVTVISRAPLGDPYGDTWATTTVTIECRINGEGEFRKCRIADSWHARDIIPEKLIRYAQSTVVEAHDRGGRPVRGRCVEWQMVFRLDG